MFYCHRDVSLGQIPRNKNQCLEEFCYFAKFAVCFLNMFFVAIADPGMLGCHILSYVRHCQNVQVWSI